MRQHSNATVAAAHPLKRGRGRKGGHCGSCGRARRRAMLFACGGSQEAGRQVAEGQTEFGPVVRIEADAVGPPGRRAFRLLAARDDASAWLWVEREQLQALAMLIEQL